MKKHIIIIISISLVFLVIFGISFMQRTKVNKTSTELINISAIDLYRNYNSNRIGSDEIYKNNILRITGEIVRIEKDLNNISYITLNCFPDNKLFDFVYIYFNESEEYKLINLYEGQSIVVKGICDGKPSYGVIIKGSILE